MVDFDKRLKEKQTMARDKEKKRKREDEEPEEVTAEDIGKELEELESAWSEAEVQEGFGDLPDDTYQFRITKAYLNKSKSSQRLQLTVEFTVATGKFKNRKKWSHYGIVDAQSLGYVKTLFARLKLDPPKKLRDLNDEETISKLVDLTCECSVKTKGDFQNVYVNKPIDLDAEETKDGEDWEPSDRSKKGVEEDEDDEPKKKRRDEEDEDEDESSKKADKARREIDEEDEDEDKPKKSKRDEEEEDEDERPAKKRKDEEDEEEDEPRKKKRDEEEEDEDEPPKKKRRDDDEDEEKPRKKSKF